MLLRSSVQWMCAFCIYGKSIKIDLFFLWPTREHIFLNEGRSLGSPRDAHPNGMIHIIYGVRVGWGVVSGPGCLRPLRCSVSPFTARWQMGLGECESMRVRARTFRMKINRLELIYRNLSLGRVPSTYTFTQTQSPGTLGNSETEGTSWKWVDKVSMRLAWPQRRRLRLSLLPPDVFHAIFVWGERE